MSDVSLVERISIDVQKVRFAGVVLFCVDAIIVKNMKIKSIVRSEAGIKSHLITLNTL